MINYYLHYTQHYGVGPRCKQIYVCFSPTHVDCIGLSLSIRPVYLYLQRRLMGDREFHPPKTRRATYRNLLHSVLTYPTDAKACSYLRFRNDVGERDIFVRFFFVSPPGGSKRTDRRVEHGARCCAPFISVGSLDCFVHFTGPSGSNSFRASVFTWICTNKLIRPSFP